MPLEEAAQLNQTAEVTNLVKDQLDAQFLSFIMQYTSALDGHLQRVTIPGSVLIQFELLMMSMTLLEICRGL